MSAPAQNFSPISEPTGSAELTVRAATVARTTNETDIAIELVLDGSGRVEVATGLPFFDHMLSQLGRHGGFDLVVRAEGDLEIDAHHTVEDVGIALGEVFRTALGDKAGIRRFASNRVPLDEALIDVALDLSGRPYIVYEVDFPGEKILGDPPFDPQLVEEFWRAFVVASAITLHITLVRGKNTHHIIEATFKAVARSLRDAVRAGTVSAAGTLALEALRIAAWRPRRATEVDEKTLPHELDWLRSAVHLNKGCYRGQETVAKVHNLGHPPRRLVLLHLDGSDAVLPVHGDEVQATKQLAKSSSSEPTSRVGWCGSAASPPCAFTRASSTRRSSSARSAGCWCNRSRSTICKTSAKHRWIAGWNAPAASAVSAWSVSCTSNPRALALYRWIARASARLEPLAWRRNSWWARALVSCASLNRDSSTYAWLRTSAALACIAASPSSTLAASTWRAIRRPLRVSPMHRARCAAARY